MEYRIINADGHTVEPFHIWTTYMPPEFQSRAPQPAKDAAGGDAWQFEPGTPPMPLRHNPGRGYDNLSYMGATFDSVNPGIYDGRARLEEMTYDGIDAEVLFPSMRTMLYFMASDDDDFHRAGVEAYNRWISEEFAAADPSRLIPMYQMPDLGVDVAVECLHDAKARGFRGVLLSRFPNGSAHVTEEDDRFWEVAQELELPVHFHARLAPGKRGRESAKTAAVDAATAAVGVALPFGPTVGDFGAVIAETVFSGVCERFPRLQFVGSEVQAGWIPATLESWDDQYWRNRTRAKIQLERLPSEYFYENWAVSFIVDFCGVKMRHLVGVRNMMWSSDYPHSGTDWPYSRKVINEMFHDVPADERFLITCGNAQRIYRLG